MDNNVSRVSGNPYVDRLIATIKEREKQLKPNQSEEDRREYYFLLFRIFLFHLDNGHQHNAIGAMGKHIDALKTRVHVLFYEELLPMHDEYGLNKNDSDHNFAVLAKYAAAEIVKNYI